MIREFSIAILCCFVVCVKSQSRPEIKWVNIPGGNFIMGSPDSETDRDDIELQRQVSLSAFKMSKYEITFMQYDLFCDATGREKPDDEGWGRGNRPVVNVNWEDANAFAEWMGCRLPTEAEWEYACRAGTLTEFSTGRKLNTNRANYDGNYPYSYKPTLSRNSKGDYYQTPSPIRNVIVPKGKYREKTLSVGHFAPNAWGLYDMHGNVSEWCSDLFDNKTYLNSTLGNKSAEMQRVIRGGSWDDAARNCRSASRKGKYIEQQDNYTGFRLVCEL